MSLDRSRRFARRSRTIPPRSPPFTILRRRSGSRDRPTPSARRRSPSSARAPRRPTRLKSRRRLGRRPGAARHHRRQRHGARRRLGGAPRRARRGGITIAVFGCGADVIYPREHAALADRICERGAIVSEFPPGTPPLKVQLSEAQPHHQRAVACAWSSSRRPKAAGR